MNEVFVEKTTVKGTFDKILEVNTLKNQIPLKVSFEYAINEEVDSLTFERDDLEVTVVNGNNFITCEVVSEEEIPKARKLVEDIAQILEKYAKTKMIEFELTDSTFRLTVPDDYSNLIDKSEITNLLSNDFKELKIANLEFNVDNTFTFSIEPAQIYDLTTFLHTSLDRFVYQYIPPSIIGDVIDRIILSLEPKMIRLEKELNLGSVYSIRVQGKNYETTLSICNKIINRIPRKKRVNTIRNLQRYRRLFVDLILRELDRTLGEFVPPSIRRKVINDMASRITESKQSKLSEL